MKFEDVKNVLKIINFGSHLMLASYLAFRVYVYHLAERVNKYGKAKNSKEQRQ